MLQDLNCQKVLGLKDKKSVVWSKQTKVYALKLYTSAITLKSGKCIKTIQMRGEKLWMKQDLKLLKCFTKISVQNKENIRPISLSKIKENKTFVSWDVSRMKRRKFNHRSEYQKGVRELVFQWWTGQESPHIKGLKIQKQRHNLVTIKFFGLETHKCSLRRWIVVKLLTRQ